MNLTPSKSPCSEPMASSVNYSRLTLGLIVPGLCVWIFNKGWASPTPGVCVCAHTRMSVHVCSLEVDIRHIPQSLFTLFLRHRFSLNQEITDSDRLAGQQALKKFISAFPVLGLQVHLAIPSFLCRCWELNSDPHSCMADTSPTKLSLQCLLVLFLVDVEKDNMMFSLFHSPPQLHTLHSFRGVPSLPHPLLL